MTDNSPALRILCIGETWFGSDARAAFAALRKLGHSVHVIDETHFVPIEWQSLATRAVRKIFRKAMIGELTRHSVRVMDLFRPDAVFVFKGNHVSPDILEAARERGIISVNYYPEVSFMAHGAEIPRALLRYDHVFNTKTYGVEDMKKHGVQSVSFMPPGYDPELHQPVALTDADRSRFGCDVSFIGTWSPKKEKILAELREALPQMHLRVWGCQWEKRVTRSLDSAVMGMEIVGEDYTRAICASSICLGILSEARTGASSGDLITARTFQIPACGTFMLHERNSEVLEYFREGEEAEFFSDGRELASKVQHYLDNPAERSRIAEGGLSRSHQGGYSIENRMREVADWVRARQRNAGVGRAAE